MILGISVLLIGSMAYGRTALIKSLPEDVDAKEFKNPIFGMWMDGYSRDSHQQILTPTSYTYNYLREVEEYITVPCRILRQSETAVYMKCDRKLDTFYNPKNPLKGSMRNIEYQLYISIGHKHSKDECLVEYRYSSDPEMTHYSSDYLYVKKENCGPAMTLKD